MTSTPRLTADRIAFAALPLLLPVVLCTGCGGTGGAWLWWLTDPKATVEAEYKIRPGRLLILIDDEHGWLLDASVQPLLTNALIEQFKEHVAKVRTIPYHQVVQLRQRDPKFDRRGAREIGERLKADLVLFINVRKFTLHDEMVEPAFRGRFEVTLKILDVHADEADDVRLWPQSVEGKHVEVRTELEPGEGKAKAEKLTRRLCNEMAEKIAKLFYKHKISRGL
jgi:hypothetical protein